MRTAFVATILSLALSAAAQADTVVVTGDRMVDVLSGQTIDLPQITITDGRIIAVGKQGDVVRAVARRIDLPGITLLPGLIDSGIKDAIRAGADTIEHASLADAEAFSLAKAHGTWFSMDIYNDDYILAEGEKNGVFKESLEKEKVIGLKQRQTFQAAVKAGVKMIFGTDGGVYPNGDNAKQFATMVTWGMTPMQALQAATSSAAEALGRTGDAGAIAVGRYGDLVGVSGDPLADVKTLETPSFVMKDGDVVKAPTGR